MRGSDRYDLFVEFGVCLFSGSYFWCFDIWLGCLWFLLLVFYLGKFVIRLKDYYIFMFGNVRYSYIDIKCC